MVGEKKGLVFKFEEIAELDFMKDEIAKYKTIVEQERVAIQRAREIGVDERNPFKVIGFKREGEEGVLKIVASGEEGVKYAQDTLSQLKTVKRVRVENEEAKRYNFKDPEINRMMEELRALIEAEKKRLERKKLDD